MIIWPTDYCAQGILGGNGSLSIKHSRSVGYHAKGLNLFFCFFFIQLEASGFPDRVVLFLTICYQDLGNY